MHFVPRVLFRYDVEMLGNNYRKMYIYSKDNYKVEILTVR